SSRAPRAGTSSRNEVPGTLSRTSSRHLEPAPRAEHLEPKHFRRGSSGSVQSGHAGFPFLASPPHPAFHAAVSKCLRCGAELPPHGDCTACEPGMQPERPPPEILSRELPLDRRQPPAPQPPKLTPEPFKLDPPTASGPIPQTPMLTPIPRPGPAFVSKPPVLTPVPGPPPAATGAGTSPRPPSPPASPAPPG